MIDSMLQEGTDTALDDQLSRPRPAPPPQTSAFGVDTFGAPFRGIGGGVAKSMAFGAEIIGAFGQVQGAYGSDSAGGMFSTQNLTERKQAEAARQKIATQGIDYSNEAGDILRQRAADILPDPKTASTSAQVVGGLADFATRAVGYTVTLGPLAPFAMGGDAALEESDRLKQQGVDLSTRTKAGAVAGVLNAAAVAVPMSGPTALARGVKGVAVGEGTIVGQSLAEREILRAAGYDKIAETFDPLDPVALALGVVPGALGARFGKPKLRTEADMKKAAVLTPQEQARSDAYERSPTNLAELERAIKAEKRPEVRALLETELATQQRAQAEHGVARAVESEPDLAPAARVNQVVDALETARLTPDDMLLGRDAHLSAVEMAHQQMARGEQVEVAKVALMLDSPQEAGTVRLFAADTVDGPVRLSTNRAAVEAAAAKDGTAVHYLDLPSDHPAITRATEADGTQHATAELPRELGATLMQRLPSDAPRRAAAAADQVRAVGRLADAELAPSAKATERVNADPIAREVELIEKQRGALQTLLDCLGTA